MKNRILHIVILLNTCLLFSQEAFYNAGNIQIHEGGQIGFHTDLINDGTFDKNKGLAGFYSTTSRSISGSFKPIFFDMEQHTQDGLLLDVSVGVTNATNFLKGSVFTPRDNVSVALEFTNDAIYVGESFNRHVDGYSLSYGASEFTFPIGHQNKLRPLSITNASSTSPYKSAYFFEDASVSTIEAGGFNTNQTHEALDNVSKIEYWDLDGNEETIITLTWDADSNIAALVNSTDNIQVAGWSAADQQWVSLGGNNISGNLSAGKVSSNPINPNQYSAFTFASQDVNYLPDGDEEEALGNYFISPNGDGKNDYLVIPPAQGRPNVLQIFNRWGKLVYKKENYNDSFNGIANVDATVNKDSGLPVGTYFYTIDFKDDGTSHQGYLYINR